MKIISVVGARPNFMKIAPFVWAIEKCNAVLTNKEMQIEHILVHTGQHYDERMSATFFDALNIPRPDIDLEIGSGTHAEQVGRTMIAFEKVIKEHKPDWVVVVGDVNATCACSITAKKEHIKLAHIEAGLRSCDIEMPEEVNRLVTDRLSDLLFTPDELSNENLRNEGVSEDRIKFVGNIMIDTLMVNKNKAEQLNVNSVINDNLLEVQKKPIVISETDYTLMTMHRPSNVDKLEILKPIVEFITETVARDMPLIWPIHPRTQKQLKKFGLWKKVKDCKSLILLHPIGYHEMLRLNMSARLMLTDSGGLQEECCVLGTPCLTLRWNTERPITLNKYGGLSVLVGNDINKIRNAYITAKEQTKQPFVPPLWDGQTALRIVRRLLED